jgi:hypothetical protein
LYPRNDKQKTNQPQKAPSLVVPFFFHALIKLS